MEPDSEKQPVRVTILNQTITLRVAGDPQEMIRLAGEVDELMNAIAKRSPNLDSTKVAIFACLQLADRLRLREANVESKIRELRGLVEQALDQA